MAIEFVRLLWEYIVLWKILSWQDHVLLLKSSRITDVLDADNPADWADAVKSLRRIRWLLR